MSRLVIFISVYLSIYGAAHLYLLVKARRAFYLHGVHYVLLFSILLFLLLAPINARLLETLNQWLPAQILAWIGFIWMGFIFIFICIALPVDGYHLLIGAGQRVLDTDWTSMMLSKRQCIVSIALISWGVMVYGAYEAYHIRSEHITITSHKISEKTAPIRIVQISDVHIGPMFYPGRIAPIIAAVEKARPDLLVSTGDLVDGRLFNSETMAGAWRKIKTTMGKFAVTGNHEVYTGLERSVDFTKKAGFKLLRNRSVSVSKEVVITGVDDPADPGADRRTSEIDILGKVPDSKFSLLLKHRPEIDAEAQNKIDLQLSGHTHQGQIFPFGWLVRLSYSLGHGLFETAPDRYIYVSRGTGTWGPPVRVLAPPEITIIDLVPHGKGKTRENKKQ
jgi:predicted MPP superfamily phosphohydrolase